MSRLTRGLRFWVFLCLALAGLAAALDAPALTGRVVDQARLLDADQRVALEQKLADFEQKTGVQVAVLTVQSLEGDTIEAFSMRVAEAWKLGQKEKDNGVLFTIAKDDRKMRIEVGYGLSQAHRRHQRAHSTTVRPQFRAGDFPGGRPWRRRHPGLAQGLRTRCRRQRNLSPSRARCRRLLAASDVPSGDRRLLGVRVVQQGGEAWFLYFFLMPFHLLFPMVLPAWRYSAVGGSVPRRGSPKAHRADRSLFQWDPSA